LFVVAQLPGGSSVARTTEVVQRAEAILKEEEAVGDVTSVIGLNFIDNYSQSNAAFMVVTLKPFDERKDKSLGAAALIARLGQKFRQIQGGTVVPLAPPPILGLGTGGGFAYVLEDLRGGDSKALDQALRGLMVAANQDPKLNRVFSTFSATNPSIYLDIDRDKAQILGVPLSNVFQSLQASLGGYYINNMNLFGRTWQVQVQAEATDRSSIDDIYRINVRSTDGSMIPLRSLAEGPHRSQPARLDPLQQPSRRHRPGQPCGGRLVGPGSPGHGCRGGAHSAAGVRRRMDGYRVSGETRRREDRDHPRLCDLVCISVLGRTVRKLDHSDPGAVVGNDRNHRLFHRHRHGGVDARSLRADRHGGADRPGRQKRDPDRGIRQGAKRKRRCAA
jgi:hypothetical protein